MVARARWLFGLVSVAALVACASSRGGTDAPGSASAVSSVDGAPMHSPGGTDPSTTSSADDVPLRRGPGPGGTGPELPQPASSGTASGSASASASASGGVAAGPPKTFEIRSDCPDTMALFIGDKPKVSLGSTVTVRGRSTATAPRAADGTQTVWIIDGKGDGVTSGKLLASSKRAVVGLNCRSIQIE